MDTDDLLTCPGMLALECAADALPTRPVLGREDADTLAGLIAADLATLLPDLSGARLAIAGALFDAAQLLRPGFPAWTTLDELATRLPRERGGIVAFGAREGRMPVQPLTPDPVLAGGPMLYLPWILQADAVRGPALAEAMETELIGRGEAGARTADFIMRTLGARLEHARYLSRHDLLAMACVQYEHAGLASLWSMLEAALLSPKSEEAGVSARGLPLHYAHGRLHVASPLGQLRAMSHASAADAAHTLAGWVFELRQYAAVLAAHQLPLRIGEDPGKRAGLYLEPVAQAEPGLPAPSLHTHPAPGLGVIAISVAQPDGPRTHVLAHALVLGGPVEDHLAWLAGVYAADPKPHSLDRLGMDDAFALAVPPAHSLH